ncbi:MAG: hypothetical protein ACPK7O_00665 [Methanobacterium sp.]
MSASIFGARNEVSIASRKSEIFAAEDKLNIVKIKNPLLITVIFVSSIVNPDFLAEIDAVAVLR